MTAHTKVFTKITNNTNPTNMKFFRKFKKVDVVTYQSIRGMYGDEQVIYTFRVINGQRQGMAQMSFVRQ